MAEPYTDTDVDLVARALADACPTPDQCADTHDECMRRHGVHWTALGVGGVGPLSITEIEGSPAAVAAAAVAALRAAGRLTPAGGETRTEYKYVLTYADGTKKHGEVDSLDIARAVATSPANWNPPGPPGEVFQRVVTTVVGPWLPVPDEHGNRPDTCGVCTLVPSVSGWARMTQADCPEHGMGTWASPVTVTGDDTEEDTNQ